MGPASSAAGGMPGAGRFRRSLGVANIVAGVFGTGAVAIAIGRLSQLTGWPFTTRLDFIYLASTVEAASWLAVFVFLLLTGLFLLRHGPAIAGSLRATALMTAIAWHLAVFAPLYVNPYSASLLGHDDARLAGGMAGLLLLATLLLRIRRRVPFQRAGPNSGAAGILMVGVGLTQALGPSVFDDYMMFPWELVYTTLMYPALMQGMEFATLDLATSAVVAMVQAGLGVLIVTGSVAAWRWAAPLTLLMCWIDLRVLGAGVTDNMLAASFLAANAAILLMLRVGKPGHRRARVPDHDPAALSYEAVSPRTTSGSWRDTLSATLADTGVSPPRIPLWRRAGLHLAIVVLAVGTVLFRTLMLPDMLAGLDVARQYTIIALWTVLSAFFVFALLAIIRRALLAIRARNAVRELLRSDARPPILLLRSFDIDDATARPSLAELLGISTVLATPEQRLTSALRETGPVLAIGRPGERLPPLGAARFYVSDELWRQKVADIVSVSQMVIVTSGVTAGLAWEIRHLTASLTPQRLVLWAHPHLMCWSRKAREEEWTLFNETIGKLFHSPFPSPLGRTELFVFSAEGAPERVQPELTTLQRLLRPFVGSLRPSIRVATDRLKVLPGNRSAETA